MFEASPLSLLVFQRTRLAPSPTGALHLGNARTFVITWALARQRGWRITLRIDDLDGPRIKRGADREAMAILEWLGMDWDDGPYYQTDRQERYQSVLGELARQGLIYPCTCTRSEILAASLSAPHGDQHELRYPGTCRPAEVTPIDFHANVSADVAWRLRVPDESLQGADRFAGPYQCNVQASVGDFLVATKGGQPSYQLAVVVDDLDQRITQVIRGDDLLLSTPRQQWVYRALQVDRIPDYWHLPIVVGTDGRRLAKRHGDTRLTMYRKAGVPASTVLDWIGSTCGLPPSPALTMPAFLDQFDVAKLPHGPVVFSEATTASWPTQRGETE